MLYPLNTKNLIAITFDSANFQDLIWMLRQENFDIGRIDPFVFLTEEPNMDFMYVNLVTRDLSLRKQISSKMDECDVSRFSFSHVSSTIMSPKLGLGTIVYPNLSMATKCIIGNDVILHGQSAIGHKTKIGNGTIVNTLCMINGDVQIGDFCRLCSRITIYDGVNICSDVVIGAGSIIRKPIHEPGTYAMVTRGSKLAKIS